jgi:hypothetical protein
LRFLLLIALYVAFSCSPRLIVLSPLIALYHASSCLLRFNPLSTPCLALSRFLLLNSLYPAPLAWHAESPDGIARMAGSAQQATNKASEVAKNVFQQVEKIMPEFSLLQMKLHFLAWMLLIETHVD